jgi:hypothetical protein
MAAALSCDKIAAMRFKRLLVILLAVAGILLVPLVAMQFTREVHWKGSDFLAAGVLLLGAGLAVEFLLRRPITPARVSIGITVVVALLVVWLELAVGIFGSPWAGS